MKLICTQENLNKGLSIVSHIANKNANLPILGNVLIKAENKTIKLSTTDLEMGINCIIRGKVKEEGNFTVQAKLLKDYTSLLPKEQVDIELEKQNLSLKCKNFKTKIKGISEEDFPLIPKIEKEDGALCKTEKLKKAIQQVIFAVDLSGTRPEMSGVLFKFDTQKKELILAATDSYRLAEKTITLEKSPQEDKKAIVPVKTLQELLRILTEDLEASEIEIYLSENQVLFSINGIEVISRLVDSEYPDYKQIIPIDFKTKVTLEVESIIKVVKSISLFCRQGINDIYFELKYLKKKAKEKNNLVSGEMMINAVSSQVGENTSRFPVEFLGEENNIIFNWRYLLDGLSNIDSQSVILEIVDKNSPGILRPKDKKDYIYIIMPIRQ